MQAGIIMIRKLIIYTILILSIALLFCCAKRNDQESPLYNYLPFRGEMKAAGDGGNILKLGNQSPMSAIWGHPAFKSRVVYLFTGNSFRYILQNAYKLSNLDTNNVNGFTPAYIAFIFINFLVLMATVILFDNIFIDKQIISIRVILLSTFLIANYLTKSYFWYPQTTLFNLLLPVFAVYITYHILTSPSLSFKKLLGISLLAGFLVLCYGSFYMMLPIMIVAYLVRIFWLNKCDHVTDIANHCVAKISGMIIAISLPALLWILIIISKTGSYYDSELQQYRSFLWILDIFKSDGIKAVISRILFVELPWVIKGIWLATTPVKYAFIICLVLFCYSIKLGSVQSRTKYILGSVIICVIPIFSFFLLMYHGDGNVVRYGSNMMPLMLIVTGALLFDLCQKSGNKANTLILLSLVCASIGSLMFILCYGYVLS